MNEHTAENDARGPRCWHECECEGFCWHVAECSVPEHLHRRDDHGRAMQPTSVLPSAETVEIDEDPETEAAFLRSIGLDPETATIDDLNRVLPPGSDDERVS